MFHCDGEFYGRVLEIFTVYYYDWNSKETRVEEIKESFGLEKCLV